MAPSDEKEVFVVGRGTNHHVWHCWQTVPKGDWSKFADLGGTISFQPGVKVERNMKKLLEVFAIGSDRVIYHNWQTTPTSWNGWVEFGGSFSQIAVAANLDKRLELFAIGKDGYVQHRYQDSSGQWQEWIPMNSPVATAISVIPNKSGRLEVFAVTDGSVVHTYQTAPNRGWAGWHSLGGTNIQPQICSARNSDGRLEVFCLVGGVVYHQWQINPESESYNDGIWSSLGGTDFTEISVGAGKNRRLELFCRRTDNSVSHMRLSTPDDDSPAKWSVLNGSNSSMAVAANADGRLELFGIDSSNYKLLRMSQTVDKDNDSERWTDWAAMGGHWLALQ